MNFVQDIQKQCKDLHVSHKCYGVGGAQASSTTDRIPSQSKSGFYGIASQMKLLVDTPEKVWSALEKKQYLKAAQLYLFSRHIVSLLHIDTGDSSAPKLLSSFPILPKQWAAISHFKDSILQGSHGLLKDAAQTEEMLAESLCAILLLEESSPRQVLSEFILARKATLQEIFHPYQHATSIKSQVCEVVQVIKRSLYQIHTLFCGDEEDEQKELKDNPALVFKTLANVMKRDSSPNSDEEALEALFGPDFDLVTSARFLPKSVLGYRPHVRVFPSLISKKNIQQNCAEWISMCIKDVTAAVSNLLKYVGSLKGLASLRDAVWDLLKQTSTASGDCTLAWSTLCNNVLGRDLSIWNEFLQRPFLSRAQDILRSLFDATMSSCKNMITNTLDEISYHNATNTDLNVLWERDIAMYVWQECPSDVPRTFWRGTQINTAANNEQESGLALKARVCTPAVQRLCKAVDEKLAAILEDAQHFISDAQKAQGSDLTKRTSVSKAFELSLLNKNKTSDETEPFDRFGTASEIQSFLRETCFSAFSQLLQSIDDIVTSLANKLKLESEEVFTMRSESLFDTVCIDRVLFLGRLCHSFTEQCGNLKLVMEGQETETKGRATLRKSSSSLKKKQGEPGKGGKMAELASFLRQRYLTTYRLWKDWISVLFLSSLEATLIHGDKSSFLLTITNWESIKIEEETEEGKKIESIIKVPSQVSSHLMSLLFNLCQELNRTGAHALQRTLLKELVSNLAHGVLSTHEKLVKEHKSSLTQNHALQILFDLRFVSTILMGRVEDDDSEFSRRLEHVIDALESCVDPFDLDVFSPHVTTNVNRQLQKCGVLFGVLSSLDKHFSHSFGVTQRPSPGSHDQHKVMPLAPNPPRFNLLPLSSYSGAGPAYQTGDHCDSHQKDSLKQQEDAKQVVTRTALFKHYQFFNSGLGYVKG
ncbi:conserved oligomeric Golgi complex subunit 1-like isoform X1 [Stylophora pistillata]|uniref:conserved oligomeric Golgi complex subunit 1-like isoform X1 n=1 Tax=Stylophora pistillata TaxID=50429 RepID=UPI000C03FC30|nr:conserved oligomeric Golgi complex subunit 1-like isoform X1 [Stylophora pistillata]